MADDRPTLVAKMKSGGPRAKRPIYVLRHSSAETTDGVEDPSPYPHVAAASVPFDEDVSLEIKPEYHFPGLYGCWPQRIARSVNDMPTGKVVLREGTHSILDPVRSRVAVAVEERQDLTTRHCSPCVARRPRTLDRRRYNT